MVVLFFAVVNAFWPVLPLIVWVPEVIVKSKPLDSVLSASATIANALPSVVFASMVPLTIWFQSVIFVYLIDIWKGHI